MRMRLARYFLILCAAWYAYDTILTQLPKDANSDFRGYYSAARHVLHGESPFLSRPTFTRRCWPCRWRR